MALIFGSICHVCDKEQIGLLRRDVVEEYLENGTYIRGSNGLICEECYELKAI